MTASFFYERGEKMYEKKEKEPYDQKTANLTPEEQKLRAENLAARESVCFEGVRRLCAAACLRAVIDYRKMRKELAYMEEARALRERIMGYRKAREPKGKKTKDKSKEVLEHLRENVAECEEFFDSDMFVQCTGLNGKEEAIRKIMSMSETSVFAVERRIAKG